MTQQEVSRPPETLLRMPDEKEESIVEIVVGILIVLATRKKLIFSVSLTLMVIAALWVNSLPDYFKAEAVILPPQQQQSSLAAFGSAMSGGLVGPSIASQFGLKDPADYYIGILKSRTIAENVVARFHLRELYHSKRASDARRALMRHVTLAKSKESFIVISVEDHNPALATALANAFADELYKQNSQLAIVSAAQRRAFFEQELDQEKNALTEAELSLRNSQLTTGLIVPGGQNEALVRSASQLRSEILAREVQLQATRSFATDQNSQVQILEREIATSRGQLAKLESSGELGSNFELSAGKLPEANVEYIRKTRALKYHEALFELLSKQYEAARIDEAKQAPVLQVLDPAVLPDRKSGPARRTIILLAGLIGALFSSVWACASGALKVQCSRPANAANLAALRTALRTF